MRESRLEKVPVTMWQWYFFHSLFCYIFLQRGSAKMDYHILLVTFGFIVTDYFTGFINAIAHKCVESQKMRKGLFNKLGSIIAVMVGYLADYAQKYIDLGITIPVAKVICYYIIIMEIISIVENVSKLNPHILPEKMLSFFGKASEEMEKYKNEENN